MYKIILLISILPFPQVLGTLFCYKCLAINCDSGTSEECQLIRAFMVQNIRLYYHTDLVIPDCPPVNDSMAWRLRQFDEEACPDEGSAATCTAGRLQVKTYKNTGQKQAKPVPIISHASVLGCAKQNLMASIKKSYSSNRCDILKINETVVGSLKHKLEMEHCNQIDSVCYQDSFCIKPQQSEVKEFKDHNRSFLRFEFGLIIGIVVFIIVIFAAVIGASVCSSPASYPTNLPKSAVREVNSVGVGMRRASDQDLIAKVSRSGNELYS